MKISSMFSSIILPLIILFGCGKNDKVPVIESTNIEKCDSISQLGEILILEKSKKFIPYPDSVSKLIFTDLFGQEFEGIVTYNDTHMAYGYIDGLLPCPIDSSIQIMYDYNSEIKSFYLEMNEVNIRFKIQIIPILYFFDYSQKLVSDICQIFLYSPMNSTNPNSNMIITVNQRTNPLTIYHNAEYLEELKIHGQIFKNVYVNVSDNNTKFEIYYNDDIGIIGFKDKSDPYKSLKFDRVEYD